VSGQPDDGGRNQGARAQHQRGDAAVPLDVTDIDGNGVAEEHQHQRQGRDHLQRRRVEPQVDHTEANRAYYDAENEEDRHLRQPAPVDDSREERGEHDDDADQREPVDEAFGEHAGEDSWELGAGSLELGAWSLELGDCSVVVQYWLHESTFFSP
jgi:hypothetical protein